MKYGYIESTIVLDNGSSMLKTGFSGKDEPDSVFPVTVGRPCHQPISTDKDNYYIGKEAQEKCEILNLTYPIEHGIVTNWDDMEKIWSHIFNKNLCVSPEESSILCTEAPNNPKTNHEKMTEIMFETFSCRKFYVEFSGILALYASGKTTGIILESGDGVTCALPVYEGFKLCEVIKRMDLAGRDINENLRNMLIKRDLFNDTPQQHVLNDIKETLCFVAQDYDSEMSLAKNSSSLDKSYELPDGQVITIGEERFKATELLFKPEMFGLKNNGITKLLYDSIIETDKESQEYFCNNIVLSGGSTMFSGFEDRIHKEIMSYKELSTFNINISAPPEPKLSVWIGGSLLSSLSTFQQMWITKNDYLEVGPGIVYQKCY